MSPAAGPDYVLRFTFYYIATESAPMRTCDSCHTLALALLLLLMLNACQSDPSSARGVAERFIDAHYVEINLPAAKAYCTGLALSRVEEEIRLTEGQQIDESTRKPQVHYRLREEKPRGEKSTSFLYETTISVDGADQFTKKILLTLRRGEEGWQVANYSEFD
jgi:hypothetical protein